MAPKENAQVNLVQLIHTDYILWPIDSRNCYKGFSGVSRTRKPGQPGQPGSYEEALNLKIQTKNSRMYNRMCTLLVARIDSLLVTVYDEVVKYCGLNYTWLFFEIVLIYFEV